MDSVCRKLKSGYDDLITVNCSHIRNLNKYAKQYSLTIFLNDGQLKKSNKFGSEVFMIHKNGLLYAHRNPGKLAKLPTGVDKRNCQYTMTIFEKGSLNNCDLDTNWAIVESQYGKGINIWCKESYGLNKSTIKNKRRSKLKPSIHLHCDATFRKVFLVTCTQLYFRGHKYLIKET